MAEHEATVTWDRSGAVFTDKRYSRVHTWHFDGGLELVASASPHNVARPMSRDDAIDPEEAFVASLASCHMLWFLFLAADKGLIVNSYRDHAVGLLATGGDGKQAMVRVTLRPQVAFDSSPSPDPSLIVALHHESHELCFIANSVKTEVVCEPVL